MMRHVTAEQIYQMLLSGSVAQKDIERWRKTVLPGRSPGLVGDRQTDRRRTETASGRGSEKGRAAGK